MKQFHDAKVFNTRLPSFVIPKNTVVLTLETTIKDVVNMEDLIYLMATVCTLNPYYVILTDLYTLDRKRPLRLWSHPAAIFSCWMYPKRSVHPTRAYYIIQCFDGNRSKEPIKYVFSLFISDNSLLLKLSMRKIINSINKLPVKMPGNTFQSKLIDFCS